MVECHWSGRLSHGGSAGLAVYLSGECGADVYHFSKGVYRLVLLVIYYLSRYLARREKLLFTYIAPAVHVYDVNG